MSNFLKELRQIKALESEVEQKTMKLLRDSGWNYSSAYVDCYWRWSKEIEGKVITATQAYEALRVEERMAECDEDCHHED